jgi:hypothetical protein
MGKQTLLAGRPGKESAMTSNGYHRSVGLLLALVAAGGVVSSCRSPSTYDDVARNLLKLRGGAGAVDEAAVARQVEFELSPSLVTVGKSEQSSLYDEACEVKNMYEAGRISSVDEGVDWLQTQGASSYARANSVKQLAEKLIRLNKNPSVVGTVEITGDSLCLALP